MRPTSSLCLALLMGPPAMLAAQDQSPKADRLLTVAVGVGNEVGFVGGQAEWYVHGDRLSVFGGAGRWRQLAVAGGLRGYLGRGRARPFLELAGLPLRGVDGPTEGRVSYGPSVRCPAGTGVGADSRRGGRIRSATGEPPAREPDGSNRGDRGWVYAQAVACWPSRTPGGAPVPSRPECGGSRWRHSDEFVAVGWCSPTHGDVP